MKIIINEKLYNTETAEKICSFRRKVNEGELFWRPGYCYAPYHSFDVYRTQKGAYFEHDTNDNTISLTTEGEVKTFMSRLYPDEFMAIFHTVEEA